MPVPTCGHDIHVHMNIPIHLHTYTCICIFLHTYTYNIHMPITIRLHTYTCICTFLYTYLHTHIHEYAYSYTLLRIHMHIRIHVHIHIQACNPRVLMPTAHITKAITDIPYHLQVQNPSCKKACLFLSSTGVYTAINPAGQFDFFCSTKRVREKRGRSIKIIADERKSPPNGGRENIGIH